MQIGMVTACYLPVVNGVTRMIELYKKHLTAAGHEVTVFTVGEPDEVSDEPDVIRTAGIAVGDTGYYLTIRYNRLARAKMREMDIIHCHHLLMSAEMARRYGRCPIVYTNHTRYDLYTGSHIPLPQAAADAVMRQLWPDLTDNCDVVITPSASVQDVMRAFGVRRPIEVIPNGIELTTFARPGSPHSKQDLGLPDDAIVFTYVGRLSVEKNLDRLVTQFALARDVDRRLHLLIIGGGPQAASLARMISEHDLQDSIHLHGQVHHDKIGNLLTAADAFVTASVTEVHPLTVIEALAAGLPVAAVASPGISDTVIPGRNGLLARQVSGLSAAIVALASQPERLAAMSAAAREDSRQYDIRRTVAQTLALYDRLRSERPDLERRKEKILWRWQDRQPLVEQLARLLRPQD